LINLKDHPDRFTIVGLWGAYILKPPSSQFPELPELEDLTLHLAELAGSTEKLWVIKVDSMGCDTPGCGRLIESKKISKLY
jgi:hypothetical protein